MEINSVNDQVIKPHPEIVLSVSAFINILVVSMAIMILPGIYISNLGFAGLVIIFTGLVNVFIRPTYEFLVVPQNIIYFATFSFFINSMMLIFVAAFLPGLVVENLWWGIIFGVVMAFINILTI